MHRIDSDGNNAGAFTEGDPALSIPATVVSDDWLNAVQEEICNVITGAGIALDKATNTQLGAALAKLGTEPTPIPLNTGAGWSAAPDVSGGLGTPRWLKTRDGIVMLSGAAMKSANANLTILGTLPAGARPATHDRAFICAEADGLNARATVRITVNGEMWVETDISSAHISLDGIAFYVG